MSIQDHPMWQKPRHHYDIDHAHDHVHWVELFYDLAHVVTIFLLGNYLSDHMNLAGFGVFVMMFIVLFFAWGEVSIFNSIYVSTDIWHRIIMAIAICTVLFMAASIPSVTGGAWPFFALGFAANRFVIAALYHRARRVGSEGGTLCKEMTRNLVATGVIFAIAAFLPKPLAYWVFIGGLLISQLLYSIPKITPMRFERFRPRWAHMSERFALLTLIVIGESFFKLAVTLSEKGIYKVSPEILFNFTLGGISTFVLAWIYFDFAANGKPKDEKISTLVIYWLAHIVLMLSAVMVGVALAGEVKVGFWEPFPIKYAAAGCAGLAGYLASLWVIQRQIEFRQSHRFARADVRLFGIALVIGTYFIVPYVPTLVGNFLWGIALFSQIVVPLTRAYITYKAEDKKAAEN